MDPKKDTQKSGKSTTAACERSKGFTTRKEGGEMRIELVSGGGNRLRIENADAPAAQGAPTKD